MSIVGFPVVPNNEYLNTCTCVHPVSVLHLLAPREGRRGCGTGVPHLNPGPVRIRRAPTSRCLTPREAQGFRVRPSYLGFAAVPESDLMSSNDSLSKCVVVAAVESMLAISDVRMNLEVFYKCCIGSFSAE